MAARDSEQRPQSILSLAERSDPKVMFVHKELSVKSRVRETFPAGYVRGGGWNFLALLDL